MENFKNLTAQQPLWRALETLSLCNPDYCDLPSDLFHRRIRFEVYHDKGKDRLFSILLLAMMVPQVATMVPLFKMFSKAKASEYLHPDFHPSDHFHTVYDHDVPTECSCISVDIIEAARIDGLSEVRIFFQMFIPTMKSPTRQPLLLQL